MPPFLFYMKGGEKMGKKIMIYFADIKIMEKFSYGRKKKLKDYYSNTGEDGDLIPINLRNFEERLSKGFMLCEMARNGYPDD